MGDGGETCSRQFVDLKGTVVHAPRMAFQEASTCMPDQRVRRHAFRAGHRSRGAVVIDSDEYTPVTKEISEAQTGCAVSTCILGSSTPSEVPPMPLRQPASRGIRPKI